MINWFLKWVTGDLVGQLAKAYEARQKAQTAEQKLVADAVVAQMEAAVKERQLAASVVKEGMQNKLFWIPWLIAAVPTSAWFGWGMLDSLIYEGQVLPNVAVLPPQLKEYADIVFANIFYVGGGVAGAQLLASAIRGRR